MSDNNLHIDKLFKDHLVGHKAKAPEHAWERLHGDLQKSRRTPPVWMWRSIAASILLLVVFGAGFLLSEYRNQPDEQFTHAAPAEAPAPSDISTADNGIRAVTDEEVIRKPDPTTGEPHTAIADARTQTEAPRKIEKEANQQRDKEQLHADDVADAHDDESVTELPEVHEIVSPIPTEDIAVVQETAPAETEPADTEAPVTDPDVLKRLLTEDYDLAFDAGLAEKSGLTSNWSIGARFSPVYSYRNLGGSSMQTAGSSIEKSYFDEVEDGILTLAGGISLDYRINNRWSIGSGMYVSRIGQVNNQVLAMASPDNSGMFKLTTSTGSVSINPRKFQSVMVQQQVSVKDTIAGGYMVNGSFVQNLDYLEVPLVLNYKVTDSRFSINLMGGVSPGILVNNRSFFEKDGEKLQTGVTEDLSPMIYNSLVGVGLQYAISDKVSVNLEPTFKYSLSPINTSDGLNFHPYSLSWFTGVSYRFY